MSDEKDRRIAELEAEVERQRRYIHDVETRCDPTGEIQTINSLKQDREALTKRVGELERQLSNARYPIR